MRVREGLELGSGPNSCRESVYFWSNGHFVFRMKCCQTYEFLVQWDIFWSIWTVKVSQ